MGIKRISEYISEGIVEDKNLLDILDDAREKYPAQIALVDTDSRITYETLWRKAKAVANVFSINGIKKGDHVVSWFNNRIEYFESLFGLFMIGAVPILLLPTHRKKELFTIAEFGEAKAIVTYGADLGFDYLKVAKEYVKDKDNDVKLFAFRQSEGVICLSEAEDAPYFKPTIINGEDTALFLLSGGTTSIPKLIPRTHAAYYYNAKCCANRCDTNRTSVYLAALSVSHDYPLCAPGVFGTMLHGGKTVLSMTASFDEISGYIKDERVTFTQIAPIVLSMWINCMELGEEADLSSMKYIQIGAAKLEEELAKKAEELMGIKIIQGYGLGEGITCFTSPDDDKNIAWNTQGTPVSEYDEVRIVDEDGNDVQMGGVGELIECGPYTFEGYYNDEKRNSELFTEDGYFKTGDKAMITSEGRIKILGRIREQINRAGENVIPSEIEEYLKKCEGVEDAAVFGMEDEYLGERICAVLVSSNQKTLQDICFELSTQGLAPYKLPDELHYVESMPLINVGKIDKRKLREQIAR